MPNTCNVILNATTTDKDITKEIDWTSIQGTLVLTKEVSKFQFNIKISPGKTIPKLNDQIDLWVNGVGSGYHVFGGLVTETEVTVMGGKQLIIQITVTDWSFQLGKLLIAKNYASIDPGLVCIDLINQFNTFAGTSYSTAGIQLAGYTIPSIKFNYIPVHKAIDNLATLIGWDWNITAGQVVQFFLEGSQTAPFVIDDTTGNLEWNTLDWDQDLTNMKNSVFVIGAAYAKTFTSANTPDVYTSVAGTTTYPVAYPYQYSVYNSTTLITTYMQVTLNGVAQTVGRANTTDDPADFQVMYSDTGRWIQFQSDPGNGATIKVFGTANVPIVAHAIDAGAIAAYGEIQSNIVDKKITTVAEAYLRAQAEITLYGHAVNDLKFNTIMPGLFVGQQIIINSAILQAIYGTSLLTLTIKTITLAPYSPFELEYQVECIGSTQVTYVDMMSVLLQQENDLNPVDDSTVLENLVPVEEATTVTDTVEATSTAAPYEWAPGGSPPIKWGFSKWK